MKIISLINSILDRLCVLIGAFLGAQLPEFIQQYTQRLSGHIAELNRLTSMFQKYASQSNRSLDDYIQKFVANSDPDFSKQGYFILESINRLKELQAHLLQLKESSFWAKPFVFLKDMNFQIAQSTFEQFQPGINLSPEGIGYCLLGGILGLLIYKSCASIVYQVFKLINSKLKFQLK